MQPNAIIISNKWFPAAHLDYYVAHPFNMRLYAFGPIFDIHNFAWLNKQNDTIKKAPMRIIVHLLIVFIKNYFLL